MRIVIFRLLRIYMFILPFEKISFLSIGGLSISKLLAFFIIGLTLYSNRYRSLFWFSARKFGLVLIVLLFFLFSSVLNSTVRDPDWLWRFNTLFLNVFTAMLYLAIFLRDRYSFVDLFKPFFYGIMLLCVLSLFGVGVSFSNSRLEIFGLNPNMIGVYAVIGLIFLAYRWFTVGGSFLKIVNSLILFQVIFSTGSRTATIALIVSILIVLLFRKGISFWKLFRGVVLALVFLIPLGYILLSNQLLQDRLTSTVETGDISGRDILWLHILDALSKNWIFGLGINGYIREITGLKGTFFSPHNGYLEILAYGGVISLIFFLFWIFAIIYKSFLVLRKNRTAVFNVGLLFLIVGLTFVGQSLENKIYWLIYSFVISFNTQNRRGFGKQIA